MHSGLRGERSWDFTVDELEEMIESWRQDEIHDAEVAEWQSRIIDCRVRGGFASNMTLTIRYCARKSKRKTEPQNSLALPKTAKADVIVTTQWESCRRRTVKLLLG